MGDTVDIYRAMKDHRKKMREAHGIKCWLCEELHPKRNPTILMPGKKCKVCGYKDTRPRVEGQL